MILDLEHRGEIQAGAINFEGPSTYTVFEAIKLLKITKEVSIDRERRGSKTKVWSTPLLRHEVQGKKPAKEIEKGEITGTRGKPVDTVLEAKLRKCFKKE